jgi:hypothetical protein
MFEPKTHALRLVYARILLILVECGLTVATTYYLRTAFNGDCFEASPDSQTVHLHTYHCDIAVSELETHCPCCCHRRVF